MRAVNWNQVEDEVDAEVWHRLTSNFWLPERVPLSADMASWRSLTRDVQRTLVKVFAGLTLLDTVQSTLGAVSLMADAVTQHEEAVYTNMAFMESVHAKSYSSIFSTFCTRAEIDDAFEWSLQNVYLQRKAAMISSCYDGIDPLQRKAASVLLESFLFYSGFFLPLHLSARGQMPNTADLIRLIIRDEAVHGFYVGYKFQQSIARCDSSVRQDVDAWTRQLFERLYTNEATYTAEMYDCLGLTVSVVPFLQYNANRAFRQLGFDPPFEEAASHVDASLLASLTPNSDENHDFFSGGGSSYVIARAEPTLDEDWLLA